MLDAWRRLREWATTERQAAQEPEPPRVEFTDPLTGEALVAEVTRDRLGIIGLHPVAGVPVYLVAVPAETLREIARLFAAAEAETPA